MKGMRICLHRNRHAHMYVLKPMWNLYIINRNYWLCLMCDMLSVYMSMTEYFRLLTECICMFQICLLFLIQAYQAYINLPAKWHLVLASYGLLNIYVAFHKMRGNLTLKGHKVLGTDLFNNKLLFCQYTNWFSWTHNFNKWYTDIWTNFWAV